MDHLSKTIIWYELQGTGPHEYPTQDTSRMGTARVKQEEEADTRIIAQTLL